jgi:hypothetical protein
LHIATNNNNRNRAPIGGRRLSRAGRGVARMGDQFQFQEHIMTKYQEIKAKHEKELEAFPFMWAFSTEQFSAGMKGLGLEPTDTDKIFSIGAGGYIRKTDAPAMKEMFARHKAELKAARAADKKAKGFTFEMFLYELDNHEYCITGDATETLEALGLSWQEVQADKRLSDALNKAIATINAREAM